jgi:hypothetical protein
MSGEPPESEDAAVKPLVTLPGKVEKIIPGVLSVIPEKYPARQGWQARGTETRC